MRAKAADLVRGLLEAVLLGLVVVAPWALGAVRPVFEFALDAGLAVLLLLWGVRILLEGCFRWKACPVALCLALLFCFGIGQLVPLPASLLGRVAPATQRLYEEFLPSQPEELPSGEAREAVVAPAGSSLSVYPAATRRELFRLLAVFLVFVLVRNNVASAGSLRRLSVVALVNGSLLALFGLIQYFTSAHGTMFWVYRSIGQANFGPFINRTHFAFYLNLCIGLGLGLLFQARPSAGPGGPGAEEWPDDPDGRWFEAPLRLLQNPGQLWICVALALMLSSVVFCLSRGGLLALLGAAAVCLAIKSRGTVRLPRLGAGLVIVALGAALLVWLGLGPVERRLASLWSGEALHGGRWQLLADGLAQARDFPAWGTGLGTYPYVEPLHRGDWLEATYFCEHADNEYLEALVEGGLVRLVLSLAAIACVYRLGYRAFRRHEGTPAGGLALGALFAFTALVLHSGGDFGMHLPAIALLAAVLTAQLCGLASTPQHGPVSAAAADAETVTWRFGGLAPVLAAGTLTLLGLVLVNEGLRAERADRYRLAALRWERVNTPQAWRQEVALLRGAVAVTPEDAALHEELADAHFRIFKGGEGGANPPGEPAELVPALRHYLAARDLCPLLAKPQVRLAAHAHDLGRADAPRAYFARAARLLRGDADLWYARGVQELADGAPDEAWQSWRRSLALSDRHLEDVVRQVASRMPAQALMDRVLPEKPEVLLKAAVLLHPNPTEQRQREPFLQKALTLLQTAPQPLAAEDLQVEARVHTALGQLDEAVLAYRAALAREPGQGAWRFQLARLLRQQGRLHEARRELLTVLQQQPDHTEARELLAAVGREIAESL